MPLKQISTGQRDAICANIRESDEAAGKVKDEYHRLLKELPESPEKHARLDELAKAYSDCRRKAEDYRRLLTGIS